MLSVIGGLTVMLGTSPLAAQSATRAIDLATVAPGGTVSVTVTLAGGDAFSTVTETLPAGFEYVSGSSSLEDDQTVVAGQNINFVPLAVVSEITYQVTASSVAGPHTFSGRFNITPTEGYDVTGDSVVTVSGDAGPPDPEATPEATPEALPLPIPDLADLSEAEGRAIFSPTLGNSVEYTAAAGEIDAKVVARVSPGASAIIKIDLDMADPGTGQKVNFSLTDGDNLDFQIKKTAYGTAEIVAKEGVDLTSGQYNFQLVVNEFENAPANSSQIDIEVNVVIDNKPPVFDANAPTTGTVDERAMDAPIKEFSASDVNHQVLKYDIVAKVDEDGVQDPGAAQILPSLFIHPYTGELTTTDSIEVPVDQPDYDEPSVDDPDTEADESARETDNEHVFTINASDGTSSATHDFTLTVNDVDEPVRGEALNFIVDENQPAGEDNPFGTFELGGATGDYEITEEIDGSGVRRAGSSSLFEVAPDDDNSSAAKIFLRREGSVDFEDPDISNNYTLAVMAAGGVDADLITIMIEDVNEAPEFVQDDLDLVDEVSNSVKLFVLESAAVNDVVKIGQDAGGNPSVEDATFTATDEDSLGYRQRH